MKKHLIEKVPERIIDAINGIEENKELCIKYLDVIYLQEQHNEELKKLDDLRNKRSEHDIYSIEKIHNIAKKHTELQPSFNDSKEDLVFYLKTKKKIYEAILKVDEKYYDETLRIIENSFAEKQSKEKEERLLNIKEIAQNILTFN